MLLRIYFFKQTDRYLFFQIINICSDSIWYDIELHWQVDAIQMGTHNIYL